MMTARSNSPEPLFDAVHLARYTGGDEALRAELLALMCEQARRCIALMGEASDREGWIAANHTLKGAARGVGAFALGEACEAAETLDASDWPAGVEAVRQAFIRTEQCFARG